MDKERNSEALPPTIIRKVAGVDIGGSSHFAAVFSLIVNGETEVKDFIGRYHGLEEMTAYLLSQDVASVAMEATEEIF